MRMQKDLTVKKTNYPNNQIDEDRSLYKQEVLKIIADCEQFSSPLLLASSQLPPLLLPSSRLLLFSSLALGFLLFCSLPPGVLLFCWLPPIFFLFCLLPPGILFFCSLPPSLLLFFLLPAGFLLFWLLLFIQVDFFSMPLFICVCRTVVHSSFFFG